MEERDVQNLKQWGLGLGGGLLLLMVLLWLLGSLGGSSGRTGAEEWCSRKATATGIALAPVYRPSQDQASAGYDAFMRECMRNQGY